MRSWNRTHLAPRVQILHHRFAVPAWVPKQMDKPGLRKHRKDMTKKLVAIDNARTLVHKNSRMYLMREHFQQLRSGAVSPASQPSHRLFYRVFGLFSKDQLRYHSK